MKRVLLLLPTFAILLFVACSPSEKKSQTSSENQPMTSISKKLFGQTPDGTAYLFSLKNTNGMEVHITNFGGIITSILVPDKVGKLDDVVLGFDSLAQYLAPHPYFGAIIGRYGNRIAQGKFSINNKAYTLAKNNGENHLHGGHQGFDKRIWNAREILNEDAPSLELTYLSKDTEEGYPGNLDVKVTYTLTADNELKIDYEATTDQPTICNLTNHSYFNLAGAGSGNILEHEVMIDADFVTPTTPDLIPTGELASVEGTPFDLREYTVLGNGMRDTTPQMQYAKGYDTNYVLKNQSGKLAKVASVRAPSSGRVMDVFTTEPGVQLYCGNWIDNVRGKAGKVYQAYAGLCLETQHYPDSPNQPDFPSTQLNPGETYRTTTIYQFLTME
ncbi:MAG: aldose epimerase family protein [Bacteroidota bacterium]